LLTVVGAIGIAVRWPQIREWWLERSDTGTLRAAAQSESSDSLTLYLFGRRLFNSGDIDGALSAFDAAVSKLPASDNSDLAQRVCSFAGYLHARHGDKEKAVPLLTRARDLNSDDPTPHLAFGILLAEEKMPQYAATQFQLVTQLDPTNVEGWYRLGKALIEELKAQEAVSPLKRAVTLAPNDAASHSELGTAYAIQSQFALAVPELKRAAELSSNDIYYRASLANALAMSARSQQEYKEASAQLEEVIKRLPDNANLELTLGLLHLRFNNIELARERFKHCVALRPSDAEAWYNLSVAELRLGNDAASGEARKSYQKLSDLRNEMSNLEKRVGAYPSDHVLRSKLAKVYERSGNPLGAYWQGYTAARLAPNNIEYATYLDQVKKRYPAVMAPSDNNQNALRGQSPGPAPPPQLMTIPIGNRAK